MEDLLWVKESKNLNGLFVDCFAGIENDYKMEFMHRLLNAKNKYNAQKNDVKSVRYLELGDRKYRKRKCVLADDLYNRSLRFAEIGSKITKLAYKKRSKCFLSRGLYEKAVNDLELAKNDEPPAKWFKRSKRTATKNDQRSTFKPALDFEANKMFPCLANVLEVKMNEEFGRHIVATCDIEVGQIIAVTEPLAIAVRFPGVYCQTCQRTGMNFIACEECANVMFCSHECRSNNKLHHLECNSIFHVVNQLNVQLAIQMVLTAVNTFPSADKLMEFIEDFLKEPSDEMSWLTTDPLKQYGLLLSLNRSSSDDDLHFAYQAFKILMSHSTISTWFDSEQNQRLLMHLLLHYLATIRKNAFSDWTDQNLRMKYIFDIISLFNHSCAPNTFYSKKDNITYLLTIRPIKKGDQIFINYLGDDVVKSTTKRQLELMAKWQFNCQCERCSKLKNQADRNAFDDSTFKYIQQHYDDYLMPFGSQQRMSLKNNCAKFITKYGHSWSHILEVVTSCFILASTENVASTLHI